jgi:hypothetical protein
MINIKNIIVNNIIVVLINHLKLNCYKKLINHKIYIIKIINIKMLWKELVTLSKLDSIQYLYIFFHFFLYTATFVSHKLCKVYNVMRKFNGLVINNEYFSNILIFSSKRIIFTSKFTYLKML